VRSFARKTLSFASDSLPSSRFGNRFMEWIKQLSDKLLIWFLRATSGFGKELTRDGNTEQRRWREQRLRNLKGLAIRSRERLSDKSTSES
jgi:hypothetical protein